MRASLTTPTKFTGMVGVGNKMSGGEGNITVVLRGYALDGGWVLCRGRILTILLAKMVVFEARRGY
jgi:hypothetical protein